MNLSFHGAARTVTGSKHLIQLSSGKYLLLDCGLFQGMGQQTDELNKHFGFDPATVDYLVLSHAHIDHSGLVPKLVRDGFTGKIFCTPATRDLVAILLEDSAVIQRDDTKYINKKRKKKGLPLFEPLYDLSNVAMAMKLFETLPYGQWQKIDESIEVLFTDAGHIIGSSVVNLRLSEDNKIITLAFSGDVGRYNDAILRAPETFPQAEYIILESTYGNSLHKDVEGTKEAFSNWIDKTCVQKKGKLIIPAFSVGRTQEILFFLNELENEGRLPPVKYFVDSPLSREATRVVESHPENFNSALQELLKTDRDPFQFKGLTYIESVDDSKAINDYQNPCVIISASGMADAGRVKHHIKNNISDARNTVLLAGYASPSSLGGKLMNGAKRVNIYGDEFEVQAEIGSIRSMSAHGDYEDILQFLNCQQANAVKKIFLVHGEYDVQMAFATMLIEKGFQVEIPGMHFSIQLS